jgi:hypothetical protein
VTIVVDKAGSIHQLLLNLLIFKGFLPSAIRELIKVCTVMIALDRCILRGLNRGSGSGDMENECVCFDE